MTILKKWSVGCRNPYIAPELQKPCLNGDVYNHPNSERFPNGKYITTSSIQSIVDHDEYKEIQTHNTSYVIYPENVDPEYEKEYPNAYQRLSIQ